MWLYLYLYTILYCMLIKRQYLHGLQVSIVPICCMWVVVTTISMRSGHHGTCECVLSVHHVAHACWVRTRVSTGSCKIGPWVDHNPFAARLNYTLIRKADRKGKEKKKDLVRYQFLFQNICIWRSSSYKTKWENINNWRHTKRFFWSFSDTDASGLILNGREVRNRPNLCEVNYEWSFIYLINIKIISNNIYIFHIKKKLLLQH